jgi:hypothetical protein
MPGKQFEMNLSVEQTPVIGRVALPPSDQRIDETATGL